MNKAKLRLMAERLAKIEERDREGILRVDDVIHDAKNPRSPLHDQFEWDIKKAALTCWREQARALIQRVRVEFTNHTSIIRVPQYVRDTKAKPSEQGYTSIARLRSDRSKALDTLRNEAERAAALLQRVRDLAAALDLESELDPILDEFAAFRMRQLELM